MRVMAKSKVTAAREGLEKSLARFDGDIKVEEVTGSSDCISSASTNHTLLLHTILEAYCSLVEPDPVMRVSLFSAVQKLLIQNQIIDSQIMLDNFLSVRRNLAYEFNNRVQQIHNSLVPSPQHPVLTPEFMATAFPKGALLNWYKEHFEQVGVIAEGGFGTVYLATHKVDGIEYAVKKIVFKYRSDADYVKVLREVKSISTLNHINIVSYYNAWMEALIPTAASSRRESSDSDESSTGSSESSISHSLGTKKNRRRRCSTILNYATDEKSYSCRNTTHVSELFKNSINSDGHQSNSVLKGMFKYKFRQSSDQSFSFESTSTTTSLCDTSSSNSSSNQIPSKSSERSAMKKRMKDDVHFSCSKDSELFTPPYVFRKTRVHKTNERRIKMESLFSKDFASGSDISQDARNCLESDSFKSNSSAQSSFSKGSDSPVPSWTFSKIKVILFIQMEYCQCDLRHWLDERARGSPLPFQREIKDIFKDILCGVAYIHSKSIIHRDLKPQNIFFSTKDNVVKIGDFGLSTLGLSSPSRQKEIYKNHSSGLGTVPYAAPEQRKKRYYDSKVDIYSLGIILIELLLPFQTLMEFSKIIGHITKGVIPQELTDKGLDYVNVVKNLIQENPKLRMSAKEILDLPLIQDGFEIDNRQLRCENEQLRAALQRKSQELEELEEALTKKDNIIRMLQNMLKEQFNMKEKS